MIQFFSSNTAEWIISLIAFGVSGVNLAFVATHQKSKKKYPRSMYALVSAYVGAIYSFLALDLIALGALSIALVRVSIVALLLAIGYSAAVDLEEYG